MSEEDKSTTEFDVCRSESSPTKTVLNCTPKRRIAVPVQKIAYDASAGHPRPGQHKPNDYKRGEFFHQLTADLSDEPCDPWTTYDVYVFKAYEYDSWADYSFAKKNGSMTDSVAEFQLAFDVQMWSHVKKKENGEVVMTKDAKGKPCPVYENHWKLNPYILQDIPREACIIATANAGKEREPKFAMYVRDITHKRKPGTKLHYGKKNKSEEPKGACCVNTIAVHLWGPAGSEGCVTNVNPKYHDFPIERPEELIIDEDDPPKERIRKNKAWRKMKADYMGKEPNWKKKRLWEFERDFMKWMNLTPEHHALIYLPAMDSDPPYLRAASEK